MRTKGMIDVFQSQDRGDRTYIYVGEQRYEFRIVYNKDEDIFLLVPIFQGEGFTFDATNLNPLSDLQLDAETPERD